MMTSVTLPSSSGPIHGGFSAAVADETTVSERDFEPPRPVKRCLATSLTDSCKKRRKQATPVRISAADSSPEGKPPAPSPEPELRCPICQLVFNNPELLQSHLSAEHMSFECKKEPEDSPALPNNDPPESSLNTEQTITKPDIPWISELPNKEWINPNLLSFSPANHMFMGLPPFTQPDSMPPRQPIRIFNPDAYCELCNKEFCNKYFLKTHKANKHGIYSDPPACEQNAIGNPVNIPSYVSNMKIPTSVPSVDTSQIKIEPKTPQNMATSFPEIYSNPFTNKIFTKMTKPNVPAMFDPENTENSSQSMTTPSNGLNPNENEHRGSDEPSTEESSSPKTLQESTSLKQETEDNMFYTPTSKMSPGQQARELDISNRLRRIGVMNPKAFCEICCKEYCNKYFLRTHKMKRHGIFIPDDREKDMKVDSVGIPYIQTSPLNLIMAEQSNSSDRKTSSPSDISCELCGIKFQNMSLFQLHNVSMHSKIPNNNQDGDDKKTETNAPVDKGGNSADSISEDLQKLQTMILQLNDLDVNKANSTCGTCNKEFENRYYLHAHMMTEHGILLEDNADAEKAGETETTTNNNTICDLCGKDFHNYEDMKKHILEAHRITQTTPEVKEDFNNGFPTPEKTAVRTPAPAAGGQVTERRASMNLTPTSSYCEICNKELCNKYFMKTHMQRMHGIEIENGAQIGGVICDICNKELCSKYFLRVHKHNTHGIVEYGTSLLQPRKCEDNTPALPIEPDPALKPADLADLSHRYFTHFTEVCTICSRRFRSTKWLKAHLLSDHGQVGAEKWSELEQQLQHTMSQQNKSSTSGTQLSSIKTSQGERVSPTIKIPSSGPEVVISQQKVGLQNVLSSIFGADETTAKTYHCSYCPFSTPVLPFLFVHERSHSLQNLGEGENIQLKCPVCLQTFNQPELLQHHIFSQHPFLPLPPFFNGNSESQGEISKEASESAEEIDEGDGIRQSIMKIKKLGSTKRKASRSDIPLEMDQTLKELAKKLQLPATYALPQTALTTGGGGNNSVGEESTGNNTPGAGYVMQAFLVEENVSHVAQNNIAANPEHKFMPSIVFLPVLQKLSAPITATFTLTPA